MGKIAVFKVSIIFWPLIFSFNAWSQQSSSAAIVDEIDKKIQEKNNSVVINTSHSSLPTGGETTASAKNQEELYQLRIEQLNNLTPIKLEYNQHVKKYIDIYAIQRSKEFENMLGLSSLYFPIFEEALDRYGLPLELKYLAIVESSLNPKAVSSSGAVGLWQFLFNTSKMFDLEINSYIDERCDPYIATDAACRYLLYLYNIFNDWQLAIASFNGGPGVVRNAIEKTGGVTDYWELFPHLTSQMKIYVPAFIAANYVMNFHNEHGIYAKAPKYNYYQIDTLQIKEAVHFQQISQVLKIPVEELRFLNPVYKTDYIPGTGKPMNLVLPSDKVVKYIRKKDKILSVILNKENYNSISANYGTIEGKVKIIHTVQKGEFYHKIAITYGCSIQDIKLWNDLETDHLYPGQKLVVWVKNEQAALFGVVVPQENKNQQEFIYYVVQEGDTIWSIAQKFKINSVDEIKKLNDNITNEALKPGQKIKLIW